MVGLKARQEIPAACDISVPVPPLAAALNDAYLSSRCANCFGAVPLLPDSIPCTGICQGALVYCSVLCCQLDLEMHQKSGECYILGLVFKASCKGDASKYDGNYEHFTHFHGPDEKCRSQAEIFPPWNGSVSFSELGGTCDLRLALRLLRRQQATFLEVHQAVHGSLYAASVMWLLGRKLQLLIRTCCNRRVQDRGTYGESTSLNVIVRDVQGSYRAMQILCSRHLAIIIQTHEFIHRHFNNYFDGFCKTLRLICCFAYTELAEVSVFQERLEQLAEKVEYGSLLFAHNDDSNNCTSLIEDGLQGLVGLQVRTLDKNYVVPQIPFMHRTCLDAYMVLASTYLIHAERTSSSDIAAEEETAHVVNCGFKGAAAYALLLAVIVQHLFDSGDLGLAIILGHIWLDAAENTLRWIARMTFGSSPLEVCDSKDRLHLEECEPINFVWSMLKSHSTFLELVAEPTDFGQYLENLNKGGMCSTINKSSSTSGTLIREKLLRFVQDCLIHSKSLLHFCHGKNYVLEDHINALYFGLLGEPA